MGKAVTEHLAILKACEDGNGELAAKLTAKHIEDSYTSLMEYFSQKNAD
jgi:DNA-binding GntR family transcriptional regulator